MTRFRLLTAAGAAIAVAAVIACSGNSNSSPSSPTGGCTPSTAANTIVIQNNQVCPQSLTISRGQQVTMINNDTRSHDMDSDPHPEHTDCPELNQIGFIQPGQTRTSGNLNTARRCGFHDHGNPDNAGLRGTITIQ